MLACCWTSYRPCAIWRFSDIEPLDILTADRIGTGNLGPRLRVLHLRGDLQLCSLLTVAELRQRQPQKCPKIQVFVESYPHPVGENEERRIRQLSNDGIKFRVGFGNEDVYQFAFLRNILA